MPSCVAANWHRPVEEAIENGCASGAICDLGMCARCARCARGVAGTRAPRLPSGGLRAAAHRACSRRPSVHSRSARRGAREPGRVSFVITHVPRPGSASRRRSSRRQTDTNRRASARRRRSRSRLARTSRRERSPGGSQTGHSGKEPSAADPGEAKACVGFEIGSFFGIPHRPNTLWSGRAHHSGRISLGASGSDLADQATLTSSTIGSG